MSYVKIWVHSVFSTLNREPVLQKESRTQLISHIKENCLQKDIYLKSIGGYSEHLHLLISLGKTQCIADVMHAIKGEASFWANRQQLFQHKLQWQDDYFAVSVSESQIEKVQKYIANQEQHHRKKTFSEEVNEFMDKYGWQQIKNNQFS